MFSWIPFSTYVIITAVTPGPNNITSMSSAGRLGFRKSLPFNLGIWAGFSIVMLACTLFCSVLESVIPKIKPPMLIVGAAYMLYLAWKTFTSTEEIDGENSRSGFMSGFVLQFVNPKIYIYGIMSMEAYILPYYGGQPLVLYGFAMLLAFTGFACTLCWSAFASAFRLLFSKYARITNTIMALLLVYCAISLFL